MSDPAAGWRGSKLNNAGENGNYWTSTPNESNTNNAYNLNFNSSNHNTNWNNRNNGNSVRPVSELTTQDAKWVAHARPFTLTPEQLLRDLLLAYKDARRHKRGKAYQLRFEYRLEENLVQLRDELLSGQYKPGPSTCFIIHDPKMREVFAADFRDRIVHHLFYNYTHLLFERTFIHDTYSCIVGRGTHFGIQRLEHHIRAVSDGYSRPCYVLKLDLRGYFMSIHRKRLLQICRETLGRMRRHPSDQAGKKWEEVIDMDFVDHLLECIALSDPTQNCRMLGQPSDWEGLPPEKSILHAAPDCGLPIGNLSSQLFSNVYMNVFDQWVKRHLHCQHYGRYVDDAYIVGHSRAELKAMIPSIRTFLREQLGMKLNERKVQIFDVRQGVEFLGAYLRPFRTYVANRSLRRIRRKLFALQPISATSLQSSVNSYLGVLSHYRCLRMRRVLFGFLLRLNNYGRFSADWLRYTPFGLPHKNYWCKESIEEMLRRFG